MLIDKFFAFAHIGHDIALWTLVVMSIVSIALILQKTLQTLKWKKGQDWLEEVANDCLSSGDFSILQRTESTENSLENQALQMGLKQIQNHGVHGLEESFNAMRLIKKPHLEKSLQVLATIGSNAPFIGLLGTVFGIMDAFRSMAMNQGEATAVMLGISKALVATAIGLFVAIPATMAFNYFQKKVKLNLESLDRVKEICLVLAKQAPGKSNGPL